MAEEVGHEVVADVNISATPTEIGGLTSVQVGESRNLIDITDFSDTSGAIKRLAGLKDSTIQLSGNLDYADAAQDEIRARFADGADLQFGIKFDGSAGTRKYIETKVESYEEAADVDGVATFSATLQGNGAWQ